MNRCAIYTRKSSDEGLEQAFNSLDAQREACMAYIASQAGEGWTALATRYDDGGFSGGSLERPALKRLLADVDAGRIETIVVYKIDRLTRSLADFARIVERLDARGASFVSVTQAFNTTSSMGRLTLNVLLSFAQFEREVTGERIRDKIAASKARGMWMGGLVPLGYDIPAGNDRTLVVNTDEAITVRHIFERYLELGSVHRLCEDLNARGIVSKLRRRRDGREVGGAPLGRGALFHLLANRVYLGEIVHKGIAYPGRHAAIVDAATFARVGDLLAGHRRTRRSRTAAAAPLAGRLFLADGRRMTPTHSVGRAGRRYRYYVATEALRGSPGTPPPRLAAAAFEAWLQAQLRRIDRTGSDPLRTLVRIEVADGAVALDLPASMAPRIAADAGPGEQVTIGDDTCRWTLPWRWPRRGIPTIAAGRQAPRRDLVLIRALRRAHQLVAHDRRGGPVFAAMPPSRHDQRLLRLAFLAPDLQQAILDGRQPSGLSLDQLLRTPIPGDWDEQHRLVARLAARAC